MPLKKCLALALLLFMFACAASASNYNSGISVSFSGVEGTDFAEEYYYFDKAFDDHRVVYLKDSTEITLFHNQFNTIQSRQTCQGTSRVVGTTGPDGIENSGDEGKILFRIDRDEQAHPYMGEDSINLLYTSPFTLSELEYEPGETVLGNTGSNNGPYGSNNARTTERYQKGILDGFGDEWHVLKFWDDDTGLSCEHGREYTSDGKIIYLSAHRDTSFKKKV